MKTLSEALGRTGPMWMSLFLVLALGCDNANDDEPESQALEDYFGLHDREAEILCECPYDEFESVEECRNDFVRWGNSAFQLYFDLELLWYDEDGGGRDCFDELYQRHAAEFDSIAACGAPHIRIFLNCVSAAECSEDDLGDCRQSLFDGDALPRCYGLTEELLRIIGDEQDELPECE